MTPPPQNLLIARRQKHLVRAEIDIHQRDVRMITENRPASRLHSFSCKHECAVEHSLILLASSYFATITTRQVPEGPFPIGRRGTAAEHAGTCAARRQDARCVGAPVFNESGGIEASLGLSGTIHQVNEQAMPWIVGALNHATRHLSMQLRYRPPHRRMSIIRQAPEST